MKNTEFWRKFDGRRGRMAAWSKSAPRALALWAAMALLGLALALVAWGDATTLSISSASVTITGPAPATLNFPIVRGGDASFDASVTYQTANGTALAGTDYTAASGSLLIPSGIISAQIPVTVAGRGSPSPDKTLQMLLLGAIGAQSFTASFAAQQPFATGDGPQAVAAADLNGDGLPDLIAANASGNTVSVLLNTTTPGATSPSFAAQQTFPAGPDPIAVAVADVNGDGLPDLIVANYSGNTVSVLLNTTTPGASTASFAAPVTFATGNGPQAVTVADLNGDGQPDLIVANFGDGTVSVLLNTTAPGATTPSFATEPPFTTGSLPYAVTAADLNGDGMPDLIVANAGDDTVSVLLNTTVPGATPSFATQQTFATGSVPVSVAAADLNGDGLPDLIVTNAGDDTVSVLLNTTVPGATPSFAAEQAFAAGSDPIAVGVADLNLDGKPDLIVANAGDDTVSVLLNTTVPGAATPSFAAQQAFATGNGPIAVAVADVNGTGLPDLIVAMHNGNTLSVLLNTTAVGAATPSFAAQQTFTTGSGPIAVTAADLNGDGQPDLIVANNGASNGNTVSVLRNTTTPGATTASFAAQQTFTTGSGPFAVAAADLNGDGLPDLIVANANDGTVSVLRNTTAPGATTLSFVTQPAFTVGSDPQAVAVADLNGDGKPDLIVANANDNTVSVLRNTTAPGATTLSFATQQTFDTGSLPLAVAVADLNGDGKPDLIVANRNDNTVSVLRNTTAPGATILSFADQQTFDTGTEPLSVAAADVNGDGKPDLITANNGGNTVSVLLNASVPGATTLSFATQPAFTVGSAPSAVTAADLNGDGKPDLITANSGGTTVSVLLNTTAPGATSASFSAGQLFDIGDIPFAVAAADLNGDGKPDLITANVGNSHTGTTVSVLLNTLFAARVSGSPATGTIIYAVPTPSPTPSPTPTPTPSPTPTPKATPTPKPTPTPMRRPTPTPTPPCRGSDWNRCGSK